MIDSTHDFAHLAIFVGYIIAMYLVPAALGKIIKVSWYATVFGAGFFLFCGLTHVGIVLADTEAGWVTATDHLQAASIWGFALALSLDLDRAARRLNLALLRVRTERGVGGRVIAREITAALGGKETE